MRKKWLSLGLTLRWRRSVASAATPRFVPRVLENSSPLFLLPSLNAQGKKAPKRRRSYFGSVEPRFVALLKTGTLVFVRGELPVKTAVTDKGSRVYTGIRAREVVVLAGRREDSSEPSTTSTRKQVAHPFEDLPPSDGEGCDIPF